MRRVWIGLFLMGSTSCYFETPSHPVGDGNPGLDANEAGDAVEAGEAGAEGDLDGGGETPFDGGGAIAPDASPDASMDAALEAGLADAAVDAGPPCTCEDPARQVCIEAGVCVECQQDQQCGSGKHCLLAAGQCVGCLDSSHCAGRATASVCDETTHACVACRDGIDSECANVPGLNVCKAGVCVQCAGSKRAACGEDKPACSTAFACETCKADADCQRFGKVCDESESKCVACTLDTEAAMCGTKSCNPANDTCTQTDRGSVAVCLPCVADSECMAGHRCVELAYKGESRGGFCMKREPCARPFGTPLLGRVSLSGAASEDYCGIDEATTTCQAVRAAGASCSQTGQASECAAEGARCETVSVDRVCTYSCGLSIDCPSTLVCPGPEVTDKFCGR